MLGPHSAINISSRDQNDTVVLARKTCLMHLRRRIFDARHEKTDLNVFVVVIPKEGWVRARTSKLLTLDISYTLRNAQGIT